MMQLLPKQSRGSFLVLPLTIAASCVWIALDTATAQTPPSSQRLVQPVYRVSKINPDTNNSQPNSQPNVPQPQPRAQLPAAQSRPGQPQHPLDPALRMAYDGLSNIRKNIRDYTCTVVKRERINGKLGDYEYMYTKVRNRKVQNGQVVVPFGVYLYFLKPKKVVGRECVYVEGQNNNKMCAHEGGVSGRWLPTVWLVPTSTLAMRGQRYPISELGIENLIEKLIEKGERDRKRDECKVEFRKGANVNGRRCTVIQVTHPKPRKYFDFHVARIFIDDEYNVPIRYAAWGWPDKAGGKPQLLEEYTYINLKLNPNLQDSDFDHANAKYNFVNKRR